MSMGQLLSRIIITETCVNQSSRSLLKSSSLCCQQYFSAKTTHRPITKVEVDSDSGGKLVKKKTTPIPKITLIQDDLLSVTTVEEAQKISKRRDLKLVKIVDLDTKTQRPIYKLLTGAEYFAEDLKQREQKKIDRQNSYKGEKVIILGQNISEHDLQTQIRKIMKWIEKLYEIKVVINGSSGKMEKAELLYSMLEKAVGSEGRIVQKRQKGTDIKFQILPPKTKNNNNNNNNNNENSNAS